MTVLPLALSAFLSAPRIIAPGEVSQTTQPTLRLFAEVEEAAARLEVNGQPAGSCEGGGKREKVLHCSAPLEPGENVVELSSAGGTAKVLVRRYVTTGPIVPGVDLFGFGPGTVHRAEVEKQCARCHPMDEAKDKAKDERLSGSECVRCHAPLTERPKQHGPVGQAACLLCHDPSSAPQRYAVKWPIQETCFYCHFEIKKAMDTKAYRHGPAAAGRCTTCHDPHGSDQPFWLKKHPYDLCTNCHTEKRSGRHVIVGFVYGDSHPLRGRPHPIKRDVEFACPSCHNPHAAQARYLWQFDVTVREKLCRTCHAK
ncbi:MAG: hypothetical protein HYZ28_12420 [Myxococcales bacterium]|nr:hypothetical protein [Myxococcales bacterium]